MKLKNSEVIGLVGNQAFRLAGALNQIHSTAKVLKDAKGATVTGESGQPIIEAVPNKLGKGVRGNVAMMLAKLQPYADGFEKGRALIADAHKADLNAPAVMDEINALLDAEVEVDGLASFKIKLDDLNVDDNALDPNLVRALMKVIAD